MKNITPKHDEGKLYAAGFASRALGYRPRRLSGAVSGGSLRPCWMGTVRGREVYGFTADKIAMYAAVANRGGPDSLSIAAVSRLLEDQPRNARDWLQRHFDAMGKPPPDPQLAALIEANPVAFNTAPLPSDAELLADAQRERDYHLEQRRERMLAAADARDGTNGQELTITTGAALTAADATRINDYAAAGVSPNTLRAYGSQWRQWVAWAEERGLDPIAALTDAALASYLTERADNDGSAPATLSQAVAALRQAAKAAGRPDPFGRDAAATMKGIRRKHSDRGHGQVAGVRWRELERAATLATADASFTGLRDAAILRLGSDALLRVSETGGGRRRRREGRARRLRPAHGPALEDRPGRARNHALHRTANARLHQRLEAGREGHGRPAVPPRSGPDRQRRGDHGVNRPARDRGAGQAGRDRRPDLRSLAPGRQRSGSGRGRRGPCRTPERGPVGVADDAGQVQRGPACGPWRGRATPLRRRAVDERELKSPAGT